VGRRGRVLRDPGIFGLCDPSPIARIVRLRLAGNWPLVAAEVAGHSRSSLIQSRSLGSALTEPGLMDSRAGRRRMGRPRGA
jgi:hypothetical protein